ncbi:MAG: PhzF family phenazine biosynthesis isomerase [Rhodospirillales bacterium]|nr:PhzF family phenazine biosynthesis isomerase [Alphaproteobacteria bacterium]MCB1840962.1 PhzF family phenazine biosynthesis isomerase [Alphaproteobacteria bacterium]MCB9977784.1 PhzF family phenazine biosynthesis isomerase [Rhodospirillales bacterium]
MIPIHVIDAFTDEAGKGNRAGVVLEADGLDEKTMQAAAAFAGFSETAFVMRGHSPDYDVHVRYFTPTKEVPICGHATIATHFLRSANLNLPPGRLLAKTGAGILPVDIEGEGKDRRIVMTQGKPEFGPVLQGAQKAALLSALKLSEDQVHESLPIEIVSTGHGKVIIPIRSQEVLDSLQPDMDALLKIGDELKCPGYFVFCIEEDEDAPLRTYGRMFAPGIGIHEDPVTGNANGPAGAYLAHHGVLDFKDTTHYPGYQGIAMGKPGVVDVRLKRLPGGGLQVQVAGQAVESGLLSFEEHLP